MHSRVGIELKTIAYQLKCCAAAPQPVLQVILLLYTKITGYQHTAIYLKSLRYIITSSSKTAK